MKHPFTTLKTILGLSAILVTGLIQSCSSSGQTNNVHGSVPVNVSSLTQNGMTLITDAAQPDGTPIFIVRQNNGVYAAYSMRCPADGCRLTQTNDSTIFCPCDKSMFNNRGTVTRGPAKSPLTEYITTANPNGQAITVQF